jgi:hypothetical protein
MRYKITRAAKSAYEFLAFPELTLARLTSASRTCDTAK